MIDHGKFYNIPYVILDLGSHPTAYVGLRKSHRVVKISKGNYDNVMMLNVGPHGGFTYSGDNSFEQVYFGYYWFGWDYGHYGDYQEFPDSVFGKGKKWTHGEILKEVLQIIIQLKELDYGKNKHWRGTKSSEKNS
jgi:hypothetical protein